MKWLHLILAHSFFIALCAVAISYQTIILFNREVDFWCLGFIFFATLVSYNTYWLLSKQKTINFILKNELTKNAVIALSLIGSIFCLIQSTLKIEVIWPAICLNGLYMLPLLPIKQLGFTKKIGFLKTILLAFTWAYVTVVLPLNKNFIFLDNAKLLFFLQRFLFMFLLCIVFDSRDVMVDKIKGLHSLATDTKPIVLKLIFGIVFLVLIATVYVMFTIGLSYAHSVTLLIAAGAAVFLYWLSFYKKSYFFYYFFVDGLMLFSALLTYLASI